MVDIAFCVFFHYNYGCISQLMTCITFSLQSVKFKYFLARARFLPLLHHVTKYAVCKTLWTAISPTLMCVLQLRICRPQWVFFNGVKGQTGVIVQSDPSISINGSLLLGQR